MYPVIVWTTAFALALSSGCATAPRSIFLGAGVGATAGGLTGYAASSRDATATAVGAATGAVTGGVMGYLLYLINRKSDPASSNDQATIKSDRYPSMTLPTLDTIDVPDQIEGDRFVEKHRVFIIKKNGTWSKD